nr:3118_t:CDS:2 [Entrophospora candida]
MILFERERKRALNVLNVNKHRKAVTSTTTTIATEDEFINYNDTIDAL